MKYKWTFANVGNVTRVRIQSGEDIRHLGELDKKMWTVLSCPVNGLEITSESLSLMDVDGDGKLLQSPNGSAVRSSIPIRSWSRRMR